MKDIKKILFGETVGTGVEYTSTKFTTVSIEPIGKTAHILSADTYDLHQDVENADFRRLLRPTTHGAHHLALALPPSNVTDIFQTIPDTLKESAVRKIVESQTHSLSSISEEPFIHDYQIMPSIQPRQLNTIISLAKENTIEDNCALLHHLSMKTRQLTSPAMAQATTFFNLHPDKAASSAPQLLLSLHKENTSATIICNNGIQFTSTLAFGSQNLAILLNKDNNPSGALLKNEINGILSRWKENIQQELPPLNTIWIAGDQSNMQLFKNMLNAMMPDTSVSLLGIPGEMLPEKDDAIHTEFTIAYGLALQSIHLSPIKISLVPLRLKWKEHKKLNFRYLASASILLTIGLFVLMLAQIIYYNRHISYLEELTANLQTCNALIPQLQSVHDKLDFQQKKMLPVAESIHRTQRYMEALNQWQTIQNDIPENERSWGIFLADEFSFKRANASEKDAEDAKDTKIKQPTPTDSLFDIPQDKVEPAYTNTNVMLVDEIKPLKSIFIGGILPLEKSRFKTVKDMQLQFMASGIYTNVDDHSDTLTQKFLDTYYTNWTDFLQTNQKALGTEYSTFFIQLPFANNFIKL